MPKLLILEAQSPEVIEAVHKAGGKIGSEYFQKTLDELRLGIAYQIAKPYAENFDAGVLHDVDGVVLTGSSVEWSVDDERAKPLQHAAHAVFNSGLPIWGSCNGFQLANFLLGGENGASPNGFELGLAREVELTEAGQSHPMMAGRRSGFSVPCVHRDEVQKLADGALLLASNAHSPAQAFAYEAKGVKFWGAQYHPEFTAKTVGRAMKNGQGIFDDRTGEADLLLRADEDADARAKLEIADNALETPVRALELKNWLDYFFD